MAKLTQEEKAEEVRLYIESNSKCKVIKEYSNYRNNMTLLCGCGKNEFDVRYGDFKRGQTECKTCSKKKSSYTLDFIQEFVKNNSDCELENNKIEGNKLFINLKCKCGTPFKVTFYNFKDNNKRQCNECGRNILASKIKSNEDDIIKLIEKYKFNRLRWIDGEYIKNTSKLTFVDIEGYMYYSSIVGLKQVIDKDGELSIFGNGNIYTIHNIKLWLKLNNINYTLLSEKWVSACGDKLLWKCDKGHEFPMSWNCFHNGNRCPTCANERRTGENSYLWKGGISPLHNHLRKKIEPWKRDSMINCGFKCMITGERFDIIHHLYGFTQILNETLEECNFPIYENVNQYNDDEIKQIEEKCLELHYKHGLGVCITKDLHNEFHNIYGYGNNNPEQFDEFKLTQN